MSYWIFKIIWIPVGVILCMTYGALATYLFKEVGWDQPYRWLCIIALIAYIADHIVNKAGVQ